MPSIQAKSLTDLTAGILEGAGARREYAEIVAKHLVDANLAGHDLARGHTCAALRALDRSGSASARGRAGDRPMRPLAWRRYAATGHSGR